jgi:DNA-directed RNA polymerase specialized sigma24 family protein
MSGKDAGRMRAFMSTLGRTERLILLLFYADQLSEAEIGLVLDLPESRVNKMLGSLKRQASAAIKPEISFVSQLGVGAAIS